MQAKRETASPPSPTDAELEEPTADEVAPAVVSPRSVLFSIHVVAQSVVDPFSSADEPPPGVQIMTRSGGGMPVQKVARIHRVSNETLADTLARVRPWFDAIQLPNDRRFVFDVVMSPEYRESVDAFVVEPHPIQVLAEHVRGVVLRDDLFWVDVQLTPSGRDHLQRATMPLASRQIAFVIEDRVLWAPRLGSPLGDSARVTVGALRDPAVAREARAALRGETSAIASLTSDGISDGGTLERVAEIERAARLPLPVRAANSEVRLTVGAMGQEDRWSLKAILPSGGHFRTDTEQVYWYAGVPGLRMVRFGTGCAGTCSAEKLRGQIEAMLDQESLPPTVGPKGSRRQQRQVIHLDERSTSRWLWARTLQREKGSVQQGVSNDRTEVRCLGVFPGLDRFVEVYVVGEPHAHEAVIAQARIICESLELVEPR